jgi:hypothetical protein
MTRTYSNFKLLMECCGWFWHELVAGYVKKNKIRII